MARKQRPWDSESTAFGCFFWIMCLFLTALFWLLIISLVRIIFFGG